MNLTDTARDNPQPLILFVDDDPMVLEVAREYLARYDFGVVTADNGAAALSAFQEQRPNIVLLDILMPDMDGYAVCTKIRNLAGGELIPILMVTGLNDTNSINRAYEVGATDFIAKPINWTNLNHHIRYVLRNSGVAEALRRSEEALRTSEERYALAAQGANDGLWDWNMVTGSVYFSVRWGSILGLEPNEIGNSMDEWFGRIHPEDVEVVRLELNAHLQGATTHFKSEYRMRHRDGTYRWILTRGLALRDADGRPYRMAGSQSDVTERKLVEKQLYQNAFYDPLTGLPNRALFMDRMEHALSRTKRLGDHPFALLFLDIDRFKVINDSLGHKVGDLLLVEISRRLQLCLRPGDTVGRLGGDEFVLLLEDIGSPDDARSISDRIHQRFSAPMAIGNQEVYSTVSVGIALSSTEYEKAEDLLRDADIAMYRAKTLGRARSVIFDPAMHRHAMMLLQLENDLRRAVKRRDFRIHYQPIVSLETERIIGVEALVRWDHPNRGLVYPKDFIPLAEETGLIIPIGEMVLQGVCGQLAAWKKLGLPLLRISVNLSSRQLTQQGFADTIAAMFREAGLGPELLEIEVTESMIMENPEAAKATLTQLKSLGVNLSLDDFGTGYSSLSYLHRFPFDTLKIDRSFVSKLATDPEKLEIVQTMLTLATKMQIKVIAEGVETADELSQLKAMKCPSCQGYIFSKPLEAREMVNLLSSRKDLSFAEIIASHRKP